MTNRGRPLWADLTMDSTREEVAAALAEAEERDREIAATPRYSDNDIDWRGDPPGKRRGCYWSKDGKVRFHVGPIREENPLLARQRVAGEEDQSVPGWDQGA